MITGIEIENPYRYRSYFVGSCAKYDVQNFAYNVPEEEVQDNNLITKIEESTYAPGSYVYTVYFANGNCVAVNDGPGLIVHDGKEGNDGN